MLERVTIVLVEPSHPGNIGAVARAMKTMGLTRLCLVSPKKYPCAEATDRAASANDILQQARVVSNLSEALADKSWVVGASARNRYLDWPLLTPSELASEMTTEFSEGDVAIVFGRENSGLNNEELSHCHKHVFIPANPNYSSLNLSMAAQVICYELRMKSLKVDGGSLLPEQKQKLPASAGEMEGFYSHLQQTLIATEFLDPKQPKFLMTRLRRLFSRAAPDNAELNILRGILKSMSNFVGKNKPSEQSSDIEQNGDEK